MNRFAFIKNLLGVSLLPAVAIARPAAIADLTTEAGRVRRELLDAWVKSEKMTLVTAGQMPADKFGFKYTPEAMTFTAQWIHCCTFTAGQVAARLKVTDPYIGRKLPPDMTKAQVMEELKTMYAFVRQTIETVPDAKLMETVDYVGDKLPNWRLLYAMENHIIHHRGQCMVYLRLNNVTPEGYLGW
jgi:hypothetical protein